MGCKRISFLLVGQYVGRGRMKNFHRSLDLFLSNALDIDWWACEFFIITHACKKNPIGVAQRVATSVKKAKLGNTNSLSTLQQQILSVCVCVWIAWVCMCTDAKFESRSSTSPSECHL